MEEIKPKVIESNILRQVSDIKSPEEVVKRALDATIATQEGEKKKEEQERTRIKKKMALEIFGNIRGVITVVCKKVEIAPKTFYEWKKTDPEFAAAIREVEIERCNDIEDLLLGKIFIEHDGTSIRYWLDRKHPSYKPKNVTEVVTGEKTLEDLLDEEDKEIDNKKDDSNKEDNKKDEPGVDRTKPDDPGQEGKHGEIPVQQSPEILLGEENAPKPDNQGEAEGNKQGD